MKRKLFFPGLSVICWLMFLFMAVVAIFVFLVSVVSAEETSREKRAAQLSLSVKSAGFIGGLAAGFLMHEAGHQIMAGIEGATIRWEGGRWRAYAEGDKLQRIALGGFAMQVASTEIMLATDKIPKDNAFVLGWLAFNILNSVGYTLQNECKSGGHGDLETIKKTGGDVRFVELGLLAHAAISAYRIYKDPKFIPLVNATSRQLTIGIGWRF